MYILFGKTEFAGGPCCGRGPVRLIAAATEATGIMPQFPGVLHMNVRHSNFRYV